MKWHKLQEVLSADKPFIKKIKIAGKSICLVNFEGGLVAVGAICPYAGEDLSRGWCVDGKLVCPYHRFSYDLQTGKGSPGQNDYIESYPIKRKDTEIYIGVASFWDKLMGKY